MKKPTAARARGPGKLFRQNRGGMDCWYLDYTGANGKRVRKKLSTDRKVAERMRNELIRKRDMQSAGLGVIGGQDRLLVELRDLYLEDLAIRSCPGHLANKRGRLTKTIAALRVKRVRDLTPADGVALQQALVRDGLGNTTVNMRIGALQSMLRWAVRNRLIEESPIEHIRPLPINEKTLRRRRRALSEDEILRLIDAAEEDDRVAAAQGTRSVPQVPYWRSALETGLRYGELRVLTWGAIDFEGRMLEVRGEKAKSGKSRGIPLHAELRDALLELQAHHARLRGREVRPDEPVFLAPRGNPWTVCSNNANRLLLRLLQAAGIPRFDDAGRKIDIHGLRHSFATRLARTGASMAHAQMLLGHSDVRLTARVYTHIEAENARCAIESLPRTVREKPQDPAQPQTKLRLA